MTSPGSLVASNDSTAQEAPDLEGAVAAILNAVRLVVRDELSVFATRVAPPAPEVLSPDQAAVLLGVKPKTVRRWVADGKLPARKQGRHLRLLRADVETGPLDPDRSVADRMYERLRKSHGPGLPASEKKR